MPIKTGALDHAIRGRLAHALVERRLTPILKNVRGRRLICVTSCWQQALLGAAGRNRGEQEAKWERHQNHKGLVKFASHC
jgi:hypothetical protein